MYKQKYLIIGAGPVGLAHVKAFKQAGLPFDAVEADSDLGKSRAFYPHKWILCR